MKRPLLWVCLLLLVIGILVPVTMALAAYDYYYPYRIYNNSTVSYENGLPVLVTVNNSQLSTLGFIGADGLDTDVREGGTARSFMVQSVLLGVFFPTFAEGQVRMIDYRLGYTPEQTSFPVITGLGGNITVADNASIELGDNFTIELRGWIDTTQVGANLTNKQDAFRLYISDTGNVTAGFTGAGEYYKTGDDGGANIHSTQWDAQTFTTASSQTIRGVHLKLYRDGSPGTITASIKATSGGEPTGDDLTSGTIDGNGLTDTSPGQWYYIDLTDYTLNGSTTYALVVRAPSGDASNQFYWRLDSSSPTYTGGSRWHSGDSGSSWSQDTTRDYMFECEIDAVQVTASGVSSGEHVIKVRADGTDLKIYVDDVEKDSAALDGASVPDNANDWVLGQGNAIKLLESFKLWLR